MEEFTQEQKNKFWTLLIGWRWDDDEDNFNFYFDLSGFEKVWKFMEKEYPELWEEYCLEMDMEGSGIAYNTFRTIINLDNLLTFIVENKNDWGFTYTEFTHGKERTGRHPALQYLESEGL